MSQPQKKIVVAGCLEGVLGGVLGVIAGLVIGFLSVGVLIPFSDDESRKWLPAIALLAGGGGALGGGLLGCISGGLFGAKATVRAVATKGVPAGLLGVAVGFMAGVLGSNVGEAKWTLLTDASYNLALLGGTVGVVAGTLVGARAAERVKQETSGP